MKHNILGVALLCSILMLNIVFTQYMVHQYFYQHYTNALISCIINLVLFPTAIYIYRWDQKRKA
ncbi:hypothetical protein [Bacillus sp. T3]|uniref:hypothetical protein n=1 Tax=Bacillus sp. T3 TaxID=467262 RepID=UPI0029829166|nr:hypothetical protein [Bacillus sp. T3]